MATNTAPRTATNPDDLAWGVGLTQAEKQQVIARLQALHDAGYDISSQLGQGLELDDNGRVKERGFWSQSKGDLLRMGLLVGAGYVGGGLTGGWSGAGAAGATGATGSGAGAAGGSGGLAGLAGPGYTVPSATLGTAGGIGGVTVPTTIGGLTTPGVGTVATSPGVTAGGTGGTLAGSTQSSFWGKVLGSNPIGAAVDIGANLLGNVIQSRQTDKAVQAQIDAANKALDLQKNVYLQQRSDLMPYADMGRGAIGDMGRMTGTTAVSAPTRDYFADDRQAVRSPGGTPTTVPAENYTGGPGTAVPRGSLASLGTSGTVNMLTPDGRPARVPQAQVQAALQAGGRLA